MSVIVPFSYEGRPIRTITDEDGETLWVAKDVAEVLGYRNIADAITRHCKGVAKRYPLQTPGGIQDLRVIHEPDLYRLIANSHLEGAAKFEAWIFEDVLPTIRKTGSYNSTPAALQLPDFTNPAEAARAWAEQFDAKQKALAEGAAARRQIEQDRPKVEFAEQVESTKEGIEIGTFAKLTFEKFKIGRNRLFDFLRKQRVLHHDNTPNQRYLEAGWFQVKEGTYHNKKHDTIVPYTKTMITGKGQLGLFRLIGKALNNGGGNAC